MSDFVEIAITSEWVVTSPQETSCVISWKIAITSDWVVTSLQEMS